MNNPFLTSTLSGVQASRFDLSHDVKTTFNMGELVPCMLVEVIPGDIFSFNFEFFGRMQPLIVPPMHVVNVIIDSYFTPKRIMWPSWEDFIRGEGSPEWAHITIPNIQIGQLGDYLELPVGLGEGTYSYQVEAMPIAAYFKIYDEWYRDQNLEDTTFVEVTTGNNSIYATKAQQPLLRRAWMHDYFTSCLPFAQKGDAVTIPLTDGPVPVELSGGDNYDPARWIATDGSPAIITPHYDGYHGTEGSFANAGIWNPFNIVGDTPDPSGFLPTIYDPQGSLVVDPDQTAVTVNSFRAAIKLQEFLERDARGGTRYNELTIAHFQTTIPDSRLYRPEFLGRAKFSMRISEVLSQAETLDLEGDIQNPVGAMAGHGISVGSSRTFRYRAVEWGFIHSIVNVQPITAYAQGINKMWLRKDRIDYPWPTFAHLGEQPVKMAELYADPETNPDKDFGYLPIYSEMRYKNSAVTGDLRGNMDFWAWTRFFDEEPALNEDFIKCVPRTDMFAAGETPRHLIAHIVKNVSVIRKLPQQGIPMI